ncbi:hypothetical protein BBJ28_00012834 [Nothophytophthora sp. Chile5]|nr:hypothetical protein BBJ28_00012834 [Nothophytophthora sp. Chile5]
MERVQPALSTAVGGPSPRAWQSKSEWVVLVENIAQSRARLASGIQLAIEKQWGNNFAASLQEYAALKESEIRDVCSSNYQEFVDSIEEIVRMKADVSKLQNGRQANCTNVCGLAGCFLLLQVALATVIEAYIQQKKLFHALKMLEELRVEIAAFRVGWLRHFLAVVGDWMHVAMGTIKEEAKRGASVWLEEIRAASLVRYLLLQSGNGSELESLVVLTLCFCSFYCLFPGQSIGESAIHRLENQISEQLYEQDILEKCGPAGRTASVVAIVAAANASMDAPPTPRGAPWSPTSLGRSHSMVGEDALKLPSIKVFNSDANTLRERSNIHADYMKETLSHLSPMLRILHVFRVMSQVPELAAFYNANRLVKCLPQLQLASFLRGAVTTITPDRFVAQHDELFKKFTGAFCLEHLLWRYSDASLLSKKEINGIFHLVVQSLCGIVSTSILSIAVPATILDIKLKAIVCARTLSDEVHEYNSTLMFDTFRRLGAHFRSVVLADTKKYVNNARSFNGYLNIDDWGEWVRNDTIEALGYLNDILNEIDELLSSFYYLNWVPSTILTQPDPAMWDLINYLKVTFAQLGQLPAAIQEAVHFASCSYLGKLLEQILSGTTVKKLNMEGVANFKRNLDVLRDFIETVPVAQLKECFVPVTQLVDLFISGEVEAFLDPQQRRIAEKSTQQRSSSLQNASSSTLQPFQPAAAAPPNQHMTKATAGQQSDLRSHAFPEEGVDLKLLLNPRSETQSRWASCRLKACCHLKVFFSRVTALLVFHVLNALLATSGASIVLAFTALSIALLPSALLLIAFCVFVWWTLERFPHRHWVVFILVFVVISAAIIVFLGFWIFWFTLIGGLNVAIFGTLAQHCFIWFDTLAVIIFVCLDVVLANFIVTRMPLQTYSAIERDETKLPELPYDLWDNPLWGEDGPFLDVVTTPALWTAVFYLLIPKLLAGVLSAVAVWLSVVQPIVVLASSGRFPCVGTGLTFQDNPSVYAVVMVVLWVVGVFGLVLVRAWSVRATTAWGCGTRICEPEQRVQEDLDASQRGNLEATGVSSFVELEDPGARL